MESLVQAEIFFFISAVATIVFTLLISVLLIYLIMTGRQKSQSKIVFSI